MVRSPSITSSHLNAVAPLVKIKRIPSNRSEAETLFGVPLRTQSPIPRATPVTKKNPGTTPLSKLRLFVEKKKAVEPKSKSSPGSSSPTRAEPIYAEPKKDRKPPIPQVTTARSSAIPNQPNSEQESRKAAAKAERFEEQRQRRELRRRENLTTTPNIRPTTRPKSVFDSLTRKR